jgi:hypothetical protein
MENLRFSKIELMHKIVVALTVSVVHPCPAESPNLTEFGRSRVYFQQLFLNETFRVTKSACSPVADGGELSRLKT